MMEKNLYWKFFFNFSLYISLSHLFGYCGGAVYSVTPVFTQLHRSAFNLEFKTLLEPISYVVVDLWQRKGKLCGCFKNSTSIIFKLYQKKLNFQIKYVGII